MSLVRPPEITSAFQLVTLGGVSLSDAHGQTPVGLGAGKPLALLCFLAVRGEVRREEALALLWDEADEERARNAFRQALHRLRLALGEDLVSGDRQMLRLEPAGRLRIDVTEFETAIAADRLDDAVALYQGDFLAGLLVGSRAFEDWAEAERHRLRDRCSFVAQRAAQRALAEGRLDFAAAALQRLRRLAPSDASLVENVASGFVSLGRPADAAEVIAEFARSAGKNGLPLPRALQAMRDRLPAASDAAAGEATRERDTPSSNAEVARLLAIWNDVGETSGGTVVIETGAADQSSLVAALVDGIRALGSAHVLRAEELPGLTAPYAALAAAVRPLARAPGVGGASPHLLAEAARLIPELRDSLQLPAVDTVPEETARLRICEGVAALLEAAAYERRICLIVDNVHRSSEATLELLGHLASRLRRSPVLIVVTFDPAVAAPAFAERLRGLAGGGGAIQLDRYLLRRSRDAAPVLDRRGVVPTYLPHWRFLTGAAIATVIIAIVATTLRPPQPTLFARTSDTLLVATEDDARKGLVRLVTDPLSGGIVVSPPVRRESREPAWADSIQLPWVNALPSPNRRAVALERVTATGSQVYVISADRRDTTRVSNDDAEGFAHGWSPDGNTLLFSERRVGGGQERGGLFVVPVLPPGARIAIDTAPALSVTEAAWAPDGSHIAWLARRGGEQEEVFVSWASGANRRNVSNHPAQEDHLHWSPDGSMLAFTSRRDGNAELYAFDFVHDKLWRLTRDPAHDDRAFFDREGRLVAFESTRGGSAGVYVMPALGGAPRAVDSAGYSVVGWRGARQRYLDRLELQVPSTVRAGEVITLHARAIDQHGGRMLQWDARWSVIDRQLLRPVPGATATDSTLQARFQALSDGLARVAVTIGAWRTDTAYVKIGAGDVSLLHDDFASPRIGAAWRVLGSPAPRVSRMAPARNALLLEADREWESGVLSTSSFPLRAGLRIEATLTAPFDTRSAATAVTLGLVAGEPPEVVDTLAPRFLKLVSLTWSAEAHRFVYAAERDIFAEAVPPSIGDSSSRRLAIRVHEDGTVSFSVDGRQRWKSTLRVVSRGRSRSAQLWLGGRETGSRAGFSQVSVRIEGADPARR